MKCVQIIFSPTGGTERVADIVSKGLADDVERIDLTDSQADFSKVSLTAEEAAVIAVPSFGGRVPAVAVQRLQQIKGNGAKAVIVCVYGNRAYEDTLVELQDAAEQAGFLVVAAIAAIAEHSIMHQYATGRPDAEDRKQLEGYSGRILAKLKSGTVTKLSIPGNRPYKKAGGAGLVPKTGKSCNHCGLCAKQCPVGAISKEDVTLVDKKKCISCIRCVAKCPQKAKTLNSAMVGAASLALKKACSVQKKCELYI